MTARPVVAVRLIVCAVVLTACSAPSALPADTASTTPSAAAAPSASADDRATDPTSTVAAADPSPTPSAEPSDPVAAVTDDRCTASDDPVPWDVTAAVDVPVVAELADGTVLRAAVYPRPSYDAKLWSQWGQGIVLEDGRVLSAIGDHEGPDGDSFLFVYDPSTNQLERIADVLSVTGHVPGDWGYGKIHAQMVAGPCDDVIVSTYWGTRRGLTFSAGYRGDILLRIDPDERTVSRLGDVVLDQHGVASLAATPDGTRLIAEAADPHDREVGALVVLDGFTGERLQVERGPEADGLRAVAVTATGDAVVTWAGPGTATIDPVSGSFETGSSRLPGQRLRAVAQAEDRVLAVTQDPAVFFELGIDGSVETIGPARGYTTSIVSPDGRRVWYVPDAHGSAHERGAPLVELDADTGRDRVLVELQPSVGDALGLLLGGTYNITTDDRGSTVHIGMNASVAPDDDGFGEVVFVVVELP